MQALADGADAEEQAVFHFLLHAIAGLGGFPVGLVRQFYEQRFESRQERGQLLVTARSGGLPVEPVCHQHVGDAFGAEGR